MAAFFALGVLRPPGAQGQELEPRAFANTPVGLNFLLAGYSYIDGTVALNVTLPVENAKVRSHSGTLAYIRAFDLAGMSSKVGVIVPFAQVSGSARLAGAPQERKITGFGDPRLRLSVNFIGAPALSLSEFAQYEQDLIVGVNLEVAAPLGQYDDDKLLNVGANRWSVKTELGASRALGPVTLETSLAATFFTANDDFLGGRRLEQDPLYAAQAYLIYAFRPGLWGSLDGTYYTGAKPTIGGVPGERLANGRLGLTLSMDVSRHNSVKLFGTTGVYSRTGLDFDSLGVAWQYRWGG
jgi:hypothetical protein